MARDACLKDTDLAKLSLFDAIHLVPTAWLKPATFNKRNFIELTEELLPGMDLQYLPELTTLRGRTEILREGDQVMILLNPLMPDTVLCYDQNLTPIGTLTRNVPLGRDSDQIEQLFRQRARIKTAKDAPVRRAMQGQADRRDVVSQLNKDLIAQANGEGSLADQAAAARTAGIEKAVSTRRANKWAKEIRPEVSQDAAAALQPDRIDDAPPISNDDIAGWLAD